MQRWQVSGRMNDLNWWARPEMPALNPPPFPPRLTLVEGAPKQRHTFSVSIQGISQRGFPSSSTSPAVCALGPAQGRRAESGCTCRGWLCPPRCLSRRSPSSLLPGKESHRGDKKDLQYPPAMTERLGGRRGGLSALDTPTPMLWKQLSDKWSRDFSCCHLVGARARSAATPGPFPLPSRLWETTRGGGQVHTPARSSVPFPAATLLGSGSVFCRERGADVKHPSGVPLFQPSVF